ncbi:uncharacterized protein LOC101217358 [Cucumis sativus]|uniref:B30.2/SPRY domain-containing protein n=1 Tax=Cucumis sativus TaxID=3659 RepID=A0A0A0L2G0_CUCSA|nr:uncharacterized protein LOC101217358 [Cucumis sativus]KGN55224.1 hypothetical protein Csa_012033 [Cucumis sativus]
MVGTSVVAVAAVCIAVLALLLTGLYFWKRRRWGIVESETIGKLQSVESSQQRSASGALKLHHQSESEGKRRLSNFYPRGVSQKPLFSWDDSPSLVNDAVENGWTQFAFTDYVSSSPTSRSRLLGLCSASEIEKEIPEAEISWEVSQGSADFMQKIRLNSGFKKMINNTISSYPASSVIKTALPLPGPPLASFPQEAYFEITILNIYGDENQPTGTAKEGERIKLIPENHSSKASSESLAYFTSNNKVSNVEESKLDGKGQEDEIVEGVMLSVGLISGGSAPSKLPGSYSGSIGFNSNGSVYLDGIKLVFESEKADWGRAEKVIGCGFDPKQKKVFFTVDSELVHVIHCKSEEFGSPLYPTLAANGDVTVLVNLGQSVFKYIPAQRTPNPCFVSPLVNNADGFHGNGYEDSRELFSMNMIDSQWFSRLTPKPSNNLVDDHREDDELSNDMESCVEIELFEIVVENEERIGSKT